MLGRRVWTVVCLVLCAVVSAEAEKVEALYDNTFKEVSEAGPLLFVKFQAPWCGYCNKFEPTWEMVDKAVRTKKVPAKVANVDCTDPGAKNTCKKYNVVGYPDMRLIYPNKGDLMAVKYEGSRDFKSVIEFLAKAAKNPTELGGELVHFLESEVYQEVQPQDVPVDGKPASPPAPREEKKEEKKVKGEVVSVDKELMLSTAKSGPIFVKFYAPWCGHCRKLAPAWVKLAEKAAEHKSTVTIAEADCTSKGQEACAHFKVKGYPKLMLLFPDKGGEEVAAASYNGVRALNEMWDWMKKVEADPLAFKDKEKTKKREVKKGDADEAEPGVVTKIADMSHLEALLKEGPVFTKFYAPWCTHCKKLAPTWEKLAGKAEKQGSGAKVAEVDCTTDGGKAVCSQFKVSSFPKIKMLFQDGAEIGLASFSGDRKLDKMFDFMSKAEKDPSAFKDTPGQEPAPPLSKAKTDSKVKVIQNADGLHEMLQTAPVFVKFFAPWCTHCKKLAPTWEKIAEYADGDGLKTQVAELDCTTGQGKPICAQFSVTGFPKMKMLFLDGDESVSQAEYYGARQTDPLYAFLKRTDTPDPKKEKVTLQQLKNGKPDAAAATPTGPSKVKAIGSASSLTELLKTAPVFVKFYAPWCGHCKKMAPAWVQLAAKAEEDGHKTAVAELDCTADPGKALCPQFGVKSFPTIKMLFADGDSVGVVSFGGARTLDGFYSFLKNTVTHDASKEKSVKLASAPPPPPTGPSKVKAIGSASSLTELLKTAPVFVKFYAPWCGHCKKMAPAWIQLAAKAEEDGHKTAVAELDCTTDDGKALCTQFEVKGFPKMKMLFADGDSVGVVSYDGGRTLDGFYSFLKDTVTHDVSKEKSVKLASAPPPPPTGPSKVVSITNVDSLSDMLKTRPMIIKFFAPWCGHCKKMAPTWIHLADQLDKAGTDVTVAEVDCTSGTGKPVCSLFEVGGYPKIKYVFADGAAGAVGVVAFGGARTLEGFTEFVDKTAADPKTAKETSVQLGKFDEADSKAAQADGKLVSEARQSPVFVEFYSPTCGHCKKLAPTWSELAGAAEEQQMGVKVVKVNCMAEASKDDCELFGIKAFPTLKYLFPDGDNVGVVKYDKKDRSLKALEGWLKDTMADAHNHAGREEDVLQSGERSKKKYVHVPGTAGKPKYSYTLEPLDDLDAKEVKSEL